jgi:hypothetical protein
MKSILAAMLLVCAAPNARAKDVAYLFQGTTSGLEIEQYQGAAQLAGGFTFDKGCSNQQQVIWVHTKGGKGVTWSYTYVDPQMPGYVLASVIDETTLTWSLYAESAQYGLPITLIDAGQLTKTKVCAADNVAPSTRSYMQRLAAAHLINHGVR